MTQVLRDIASTDCLRASVKTIPGVQEIKDTDLPALRRLLNRYEWRDPYSGSAAYYGLTGRHGLWLARNGDAFMLIARHPGDQDKLLLFPPTGEDRHHALKDVLRGLSGIAGNFQFARIPAAQVTQVRYLSRWFADAATQVAIGEMALDWHYPVHVLDTGAVAIREGRAFKDFRKNVGRVDAARISAEPLIPDVHRGAVDMIACAWSVSKDHSDSAALQTMVEPYRRLVELMAYLPIKGRLYRLDDQPVGFALWEETDPGRGVANSLADLTTRQTRGLSEFIYADMCGELARAGYSSVCIGGSEEAGLDRFKRKMQPIASVELTSLHYEGARGRSFPAHASEKRPAVISPHP